MNAPNPSTVNQDQQIPAIDAFSAIRGGGDISGTIKQTEDNYDVLPNCEVDRIWKPTQQATTGQK